MLFPLYYFFIIGFVAFNMDSILQILTIVATFLGSLVFFTIIVSPNNIVRCNDGIMIDLEELIRHKKQKKLEKDLKRNAKLEKEKFREMLLNIINESQMQGKTIGGFINGEFPDLMLNECLNKDSEETEHNLHIDEINEIK